jgi:hypothetical protein
MNVPNSEAENNDTASSTKIPVITIRRADTGTVRTIEDVGVGPSLTPKECKVIQQPGQWAWVNPPSREWQGSDGKRHFSLLVELIGSLRKRVDQAIVEAWERSKRGRTHG